MRQYAALAAAEADKAKTTPKNYSTYTPRVAMPFPVFQQAQWTAQAAQKTPRITSSAP